MNKQELATQFLKEHEGIGYQSNPQMIAIRAFAEWLENKDIERERILREALELGLFILTIPAVQDVNKAINNERPSQNPIADFEKKAREALKAVSK